jgi:hypothetical protein
VIRRGRSWTGESLTRDVAGLYDPAPGLLNIVLYCVIIERMEEEQRSEVLLEFVAEAARRREEAEHHFRRTITAARSAKFPLARIAEAAGLSVSRIHAITGEENTMTSLATPLADEGDDLLIVAAGKTAWQDWLDFHAYLCQTERPFRNTEHIGFYHRGVVEPCFPRIRLRRDNVEFSHEHASMLRQSQDELERELAELIVRVLDAGRAYDGELYQVFLLSGAEHPETIAIDEPIRHEGSGRGSAFTQGARYVSEVALRSEPRTTAELLLSSGPRPARVSRAPRRSRNKGLTDPQFDRIPNAKLRYWRDFWLGKTSDKYWEKGFTKERAARDLSRIEKEIAARQAEAKQG